MGHKRALGVSGVCVCVCRGTVIRTMNYDTPVPSSTYRVRHWPFPQACKVNDHAHAYTCMHAHTHTHQMDVALMPHTSSDII